MMNMSFTSIGSCQELAWTLTGHQHGDKIINLNLGLLAYMGSYGAQYVRPLGMGSKELAFDCLVPGASLDAYRPPTWGQNYQFEFRITCIYGHLRRPICSSFGYGK
jgi:hypothetical protein